MTEGEFSRKPSLVSRLGVLKLQFLLYLLVGGLSSGVDVTGFWLLIRLGLQFVLASIVSFSLATAVNYFLSYKIAFVRGRLSRQAEVFRVTLISLVGLLANTATLFLLVALFGLTGIASKIIALPVVLVWNFAGRRLFVFHRDKLSPALHFVEKYNRSVGKTEPSFEAPLQMGVRQRTSEHLANPADIG